LAPVSISDDWTYIRSVEYLINQWQFHILPVAAATQITQLFWGGAFGLIFGVTPGVLRVSTIAIVLLSALALRDMFRDLKVSNQRAALGTALYLFNPIMFAISYSFMSDPHFVAWMTLSAWLYLKAEMHDRTELLWWASVLATIACLERPHGAFIPIGVATWYLLTGRLRIDRQPIRSLAAIGLIPAVAMLLLYTVINGLPSQQGLFLSEMEAAGPTESWLLIKRLAVIEIAYTGFFVLPLIIGVGIGVWRALGNLPTYAIRLVIGAVAVTAAGIAWFWNQGRLMPYIPHFFGRGGPGSGDLQHSRPPLFGPTVFEWLTIACGVAAICALILFLRSVAIPKRFGRSGIGLLTCLLGWQAIGVLPQSFLFRNWIISLDRYLLPMLPFVVVIAVWAVDDREIMPLLAWPAMAVVALFSIAGTRDVLVFQSDVWQIAHALNTAGVPNTRLDAGYAWDAYHLWEFSYQNHLEPRTENGPWWVMSYAQATDSTYVIAGAPIQGYVVISAHEYSSWLHERPMYLYVMRRLDAPPDGVTWPP
jgi:dolichyl-phosphate-mannose-protein mannosyltransferase